MKKIIQAGLIVSGLASSLVAALPPTEDLKIDVLDTSVTYAGGGLIDKNHNVGHTTFKMTYADKVVTDAVFDYMSTTNNMSIKGFDTTKSNEGIYTLYVSYKKNLQSCHLKILRPKESIDFYATTQNNDGRNNFTIEMPNCFDEDDKYHFETEHPYANNTHTVKVLPPLCEDDETCIAVVGYAKIVGETEKNYDFVTVYQNGQVLKMLDGVIDGDYEISNSLPTEIHFDSDYSVNKNGVTIDLHY